MKKCPHCGKEYSDKSQYCLECGTLLESVPDPPRNTLIEHLKYGFSVVQKRPSVFLPIVAVYIVVIVFAVVFVLSIGLNYAVLEDPSQIDMGMLGGMTVGLLVFFLAMIYIGLIYEPLAQNVYFNATTGQEIKFWNSFRYANSRIVSFLGAYLLGGVIGFPIMFFWMSKIPYE